MSREDSSHSKDIHGVGKLTSDAINGITDLVETMHHIIMSFGKKSNESDSPRTKGITGVVYKNIRNITKVTGKGLDVSLNKLSTLLAKTEPSPKREVILSALNGVLGDYLMDSGNSLSIEMGFRREGKYLSDEELSGIIAQSNGKLLILVHGSSMSDLQWKRKGHDHGATISRDLGITPIYLHYNTGLHTSENGKLFSKHLEALIALSSQPVELFIVAYSMGGLVSRSACHYGEFNGHTWVHKLTKLVFLGTPHHGALLEKGANWFNNLLELNPYSEPFARLGKVRSRGLTDLRYGNVVDEDWQGQDRFEITGDIRTPVPLPERVQCYTMAGTTSKEESKVGDDLIGDGLVTLKSALGRHQNPEMQLLFPEPHQWVAREVSHFDLLNQPEAYEVLKRWLAS